MTRWAALALATAIAAAPAAAEVTAVSPTGFTIELRGDVAAPPAEAWQALLRLPQWWSDQHTFSGRAANMSLKPQAGGCWCERWGDGRSVLHGQVAWVQAPQTLRVYANLGPLQELAVNGVLTFTLREQDGKTTVRLTYRVSGAPDAGLDKLAPIVDRVLGEQHQRLIAFVGAGKAR
jgi:uncharacterized protein YndB with AHSA1/START domain